MTCNFKNSAGTDLDDLFYTDNSNAGALGFKNSSGTDLGNKYSDTSTLGYAVGYKNSAGTDMGYLRGASAAVSSVTWNTESQKNWQTSGGVTMSEWEPVYFGCVISAELTITANTEFTQVEATLYAAATSGSSRCSGGCTSPTASSCEIAVNNTGNWDSSSVRTYSGADNFLKMVSVTSTMSSTNTVSIAFDAMAWSYLATLTSPLNAYVEVTLTNAQGTGTFKSGVYTFDWGSTSTQPSE